MPGVPAVASFCDGTIVLPPLDGFSHGFGSPSAGVADGVAAPPELAFSQGLGGAGLPAQQGSAKY